ncbi:MAG: ATP-binding cassette domain-containing protein, partial [Anaerolineales bacterium]|nr:ATP-binding cassette domain-containing protein [Anaerolineales bacterium]
SSWLEQKETRLKQEEKAESQRQKTLARELEWIRMSPKARQSKGKARVTSYENLLSQEAEKRREDLEIYIPPGPRLGDVVFEFDKVTKSYDDRLILDEFTASVPPGSIVGIIGPNGAGKTTLLKMITGKEKPDSGNIKIGETVKIAYADQSRTLDSDKTVYEEISGGADFLELGKRKINARAYCASFNFQGSDQQKKISVLSGGERNRVHLAKTLIEPTNALLLDEPTNDLDVNTLRALEEAIEEFAGVVVVVSHDRWFLDRICTHIIAFEGDSVAKMYLGNWSDYEAMMMEKFGKDITPHRVKYRQLKR